MQILSDLHLEVPKSYDIFEVTPAAPYLALLGDIGVAVEHKDDLRAFLAKQLAQFKAVLYVPGNHEAYRSTWQKTIETLRGLEAEFKDDTSLGQFILMDRKAFRPPGCNTVVLGCSLFSHVPIGSCDRVSMALNDFYQTADWTVDDHNKAHAKDLAWLNDEVDALAGPDVDIVVLTHWSPSTDERAIEPRHAQSPIGSAFSTDLSGHSCFRSANVKTWAFGHTHFNCDFEAERDGAGPLRIITNQRGYYFAQAAGFDPKRTIGI